MLDGWYCRTMANEQASSSQNLNETEDGDQLQHELESGSEDSQDATPQNFNNHVDYKSQYRYLKQKLKFLIYENEFYQDALRSHHRKLLKVTRDRSFLLDRLLQYEKPEASSSESDETESSEDEVKEPKKRKTDQPPSTPGVRGRKKKVLTQKQKLPTNEPVRNPAVPSLEGHMTAEEVERHLQSRQPKMELVPERAPPTVPNEMFSNEPSLDSESNDQTVETSPSNIGEEFLSVEYNNS